MKQKQYYHWYYRIKSNGIPRITRNINEDAGGYLENHSFQDKRKKSYRHYLMTTTHRDRCPKLGSAFEAVNTAGTVIFTLSNEYWITLVTEKILTRKR